MHKLGTKLDIHFFRPRSTLLFIDKRFFDKYNVLYRNQCEFLKNETTTDSFLKYRCLPLIFNNEQLMISVFLDLKKMIS